MVNQVTEGYEVMSPVHGVGVVRTIRGPLVGVDWKLADGTSLYVTHDKSWVASHVVRPANAL